MKVDVECYAARKADERPVRFRPEGKGKQYSVENVLDQWYERDSILYKIRTDDGNLYILRQRTSSPDGAWDLVSFREEKGRCVSMLASPGAESRATLVFRKTQGSHHRRQLPPRSEQ